MTTHAAQALIEEYVTEVKERIEDDKNYIRASQVGSHLWSPFKILVFFIKSYALIFSVLFIISICLIDDGNIRAIASAPATEIVSGLKLLIWLYTALFVPSFLITCLICRNYFFRDRKQERLDYEQEELERMKTVVVVCEELLKRHKLINQSKGC